MAKRIILVDDEPAVRLLIRDSIESVDGYEVVAEGEDGEEALQLYKELKPDLVLMDALMPGVDGVQGLENIIAYDSQAKIIMISAFEEALYRQEFLKLGAKGCLSKPFELSQLIDTIEAVF